MNTQALYIARIQRQLDDLSVQMSDMEERARQARPELRQQYMSDMTLLRAQHKQASDRLDDMRRAAAGTWRRRVADMEKLRLAIVSTFRYVKSQV